MVYTQLVNFERDEWYVARTQKLQEEDRLIKVGFVFVRYSEIESKEISELLDF